MKPINKFILEKLKVTKDTNDSPSEFYELAKMYDLWYRRQRSRYPEISLKGIYRSNEIEPPTSEENIAHLPYPLTKLQIILLSNGSCKVFLIFEHTKMLRVNESYMDYDKLIERLGNGNYADGEKIYQAFLEYLKR